MPGKLQHSQRGRNQISGTKTACFASLDLYLQAGGGGSERRGTMGMLLYSCVCAKLGREDQRD